MTEEQIKKMNEEFKANNSQPESCAAFWSLIWTLFLGIFGLGGYLLYLCSYSENKEEFKDAAIVGVLTLFISSFIYYLIIFWH